jgi:hypothetical protein
MNMSKITKATLKSFIKKNKGKLYIKSIAEFDGMIDGMSYNRGNFNKAVETTEDLKETLGIKGIDVWGSRNTFFNYRDDNFTGIEVYNCCTRFIVAIPN